MTSSILTDASAMTALQNLSATQKALTATQSQIASGLKVSTASDNAAYWSISSTLKSDMGALSAVSDALNLSASVLGVAAAAVTATLGLMNRIKADLVTAQQPGTSAAQVQTDIAAQQRSIIAVLGSASFRGVNLLDGSAGNSVSFVTSFVRGSTGATSVTASTLSTAGGTLKAGLDYVLSGIRLAGPSGLLSDRYLAYPPFNVGSAVYGQAGTGTGAGAYLYASILSLDITSGSVTDIKNVETVLDGMVARVQIMATNIASIQTTVASQQTYVASLSNALTSGMGALVDADMNVASTRLQALQTQQQLGVQALSIANQNSQLVLRLFAAG